ncbi:MAG: biopolymer transporter ExbD [Planctomycetota bacterium]
MRKPDRRRSEAGVDLDMTPMIDVTFLLLIFFLCLEFKTLEGKLQANLPKDLGPHHSAAVPIDKVDLEVRCLARGTERTDPHGGRFDLVGHELGWRLGPVPTRTPRPSWPPCRARPGSGSRTWRPGGRARGS